jgi:hypothetical protein
MSIRQHYYKAAASLAILIVAIVPLFGSLSTYAAAGVSLSLSTNNQAVSSGSNEVVSIIVNTNGASINTVQSVFTYSASNYSLVSISPGSDFPIFPTPTKSSDSVAFSAAANVGSSVTGTQTVAVVTLRATASGTSAMQLAKVCSSGNYTNTCSAAYNSSTNANNLTIVSGGNFTVNSSSAHTTTTANPAPIISNIKVSGLSSNSATIAWHTNLPASSVVEFGFNDKFGQSIQSNALTTTHSISLASPELTTGNSYSFAVVSATANGASSTSSTGHFTTSGYSVLIRVVDANGKIVQGALVTADGQSKKANSAGVVSFQNMPSGAQTVSIKVGTTSTKRTIKVGATNPSTSSASAQLQSFNLSAVRSKTNYTIYAIIALVIVVGVVLLIYRNPRRGLLLQELDNPVGFGNPVDHGNDAAAFHRHHNYTNSANADHIDPPGTVVSPDTPPKVDSLTEHEPLDTKEE